MSGVVRYRHDDRTRYDRLLLPDGRFATSVRLSELRPIMGRLGIAVTPQMTKDDLLDAFAERIQAAAAELRTPATNPSAALSQEAMREAVAFIARQANA